MSKYKILISGASGNLGKKLIKGLASDKNNLLESLEIDLIVRDYDQEKINTVGRYVLLDDFLNKSRQRYDAIIHTATNYISSDKSIIEGINANIMLGARLLECIDESSPIGCFINIDTALPENAGYYAATKKCFRRILEYYSSKNSLRVVNVRPDYIYGDDVREERYIGYVLTRALLNEDIEVKSPNNTRCFIVDTEFASFILRVLQKKLNEHDARSCFENIDVTSGVYHNHLQAAELIKNVVGSRSNIVVCDNKADLVSAQLRLDDKIQNEMYNFCFTPFDRGVREIINSAVKEGKVCVI